MKSDVLKLDGTIELNEKAFVKVEALANYYGFDSRDVLIVRLLAEEGTKAISNILRFNNGELWVETSDKDFDIHIKVNTFLEENQKKDFIAMSKDKTNTPKKGILGRISMIMDEIFFGAGMQATGCCYDLSCSVIPYYWSMSESWNSDKKEDKSIKDEFEGIEQSIIEKFATDINVTVLTNNAELVIKKSK
ncbi:hypothetical protein [Candidatus Formimonas warabiya]|uniref:Uncharacterized protein n=1 Tax=Formimonas warabiya TaxID=1761012 RepID=A0A3G1KTL0_FORW1|nr:hypothetical protein [Candidatus Formimonas warabiya]ATW25802.1 hypothetical protein DCMF_14430 [Candidatus Formimonas warabiya]